MSIPPPAYPETALAIDRTVHERLASDGWRRDTVSEHVIGVRSGHALDVPAGHIVRFSITDGPQVVDLNLWSRHDPREHFWASRTRQLHGAHVTTFDRLWSCLPFLRPMATIIGDSVAYGIDEDGAGCHDLLGTRCDPYVSRMLSGRAYDFHCHSNLLRAIQPYGLTEFDVHDVINLFQVTGLTPGEELYYMKASPAQPGDFVELFAEIDLLVAASTCPGGDLSVPMWGAGSDAEPRCHPIKVEVFRPEAGALEGWRSPEVASYRGMHGVRHGYWVPEEPPPPLTEAVPVSQDGQ